MFQKMLQGGLGGDGGKIEPTLIWERETATTSMDAGYLDLPSSSNIAQYSHLLFEVYFYYNIDKVPRLVITENLPGTKQILTASSEQYASTSFRPFCVNYSGITDKIYFWHGYEAGLNSSDVYCIPYKIWGIKELEINV